MSVGPRLELEPRVFKCIRCEVRVTEEIALNGWKGCAFVTVNQAMLGLCPACTAGLEGWIKKGQSNG